MRAIIEIDVPDYQIGQEVSIYFKDTMMIKGVVKEQSGDLISRDAVLDAMSDIWKHICFVARHRKPTKGEEAVYFDMVGTVKGMSSVNPQEPKEGHWKRISIDKYSEHAKYWYRCDKCGKDNLGITNWCPNCGARMGEPQDKDIIWYDKRNYSEIVVKPQGRSEKE